MWKLNILGIFQDQVYKVVSYHKFTIASLTVLMSASHLSHHLQQITQFNARHAHHAQYAR
jgi:hypothetical protein